MTSQPIVTCEIAPLPTRAADAHKGQVGRVMIIGGCVGQVTMIGAPALTARAALRSGAGLVQLVVPNNAQIAAVTIEPCATARALPSYIRQEEQSPPQRSRLESSDQAQREASLEVTLSAMAEDFQADVVAVGPGLGGSIPPEALKELLTSYDKPMVVDADALNQLASMTPFDIPNPQRVVLTPHPGEMKRLIRGWTDREPPANRRAAALSLVDAFGTVVVLKGKGTVVTNGERLFVSQSGNAGMASAGTGDVLTGIIAAMIGQGLATQEAAILGVHLHGLAGDFAALELGQLPLTAIDLIDALPDAFAEHGQ